MRAGCPICMFIYSMVSCSLSSSSCHGLAVSISWSLCIDFDSCSLRYGSSLSCHIYKREFRDDPATWCKQERGKYNRRLTFYLFSFQTLVHHSTPPTNIIFITPETRTRMCCGCWYLQVPLAAITTWFPITSFLHFNKVLATCSYCHHLSALTLYFVSWTCIIRTRKTTPHLHSTPSHSSNSLETERYNNIHTCQNTYTRTHQCLYIDIWYFHPFLDCFNLLFLLFLFCFCIRIYK